MGSATVPLEEEGFEAAFIAGLCFFIFCLE